MKKVFTVMALGCAMFLTGCGTIPSNPAIMAGLTIGQVSSGDYIDNAVKPVKKGEATVKGIVLFTNGDASISKAMQNGGITKIHHVDYKITTYFYMYTVRTTIVYGE